MGQSRSRSSTVQRDPPHDRQRNGERRRTMWHSGRFFFGFVCAMALVLGPLSFPGPPAQAANGAATWSLDGAPGQLGFEEVDTISCPDTTYCVALASNQYEDDALILNAGTWHTAPLVEPGGALDLNSVSCFSESFCMAVGESFSGSGTRSNGVGVIEEWDGSAWSMVPNPQSSGVNVSLNSVSCPTRQVVSLSDRTTLMAGSLTAGTARPGRCRSINRE